ncbi:hypothetical protein QEN19_001277 [Hanseniaspora menglaensis]
MMLFTNNIFTYSHNLTKILNINKTALRYISNSEVQEPFSSFSSKIEAENFLQKQPRHLIRTFDEHVQNYRYLVTSTDIAKSSRKILAKTYKQVYNLEAPILTEEIKPSIDKNHTKSNKAEYRKIQLMIRHAGLSVYSLFLRKNIHLETNTNKKVTTKRYFGFNSLGIQGRIEIENKFIETREKLMNMLLVESMPNEKWFKQMLYSTRYARREYFAIKTLPKIFEANKDELFCIKNSADIIAFSTKVETQLQHYYNSMTLKEAVDNYKESYELLYKRVQQNKALYLDSNCKKIIDIYENVIPELDILYDTYLTVIHRNWNKILDYESNVNVRYNKNMKIPLFNGHGLVEASKSQRALTGLIKYAKLNSTFKKYDKNNTDIKTFTPDPRLKNNSSVRINKTKKYSSKEAEKAFFDNLF